MDNNVKSMFIKINGITDLTNFVKEASQADGDIEVRKGSWCIDASSFMGVMSIDMSTGVTVIYPSDAANFEAYIEQFRG